jgi:peptidoglycan/LPS O-acetylase OafA/YrhL
MARGLGHGPVTGPSLSGYRSDIQGLRGVAVILVLLYHAAAVLPGGFIGVDVFFVISGYVIAGSLQREWTSTGGISFRRFYARRVRRLLPALALLTVSTVLVSILFQSPNGPQQETAKTAFGATAFVANFVIFRSIGDYFSPIAENNPLLHIWSLSVEEQFFLVFPAAMAIGWSLARRQGTNRSIAAWIVAGVFLIPSILLSVSASYSLVDIPLIGGPSRLFAFYSSFTRAWEFAVGALLVLLAPQLSRLPEWLLARLSGTGFVLILGSAVIISEDWIFPGFVVLLPVTGAAALILSGSTRRSAGRTMLEHPLLVWIGDLSYSWYLWHWPVVVFTRLYFSDRWWALLTAAGVSLVPAYLSWRYLESPIMRSVRLSGRRVLGLLVVALLVPGLVTTVLAVGSRSGWGLDWPVGAHLVVQNDCDHGEFSPSACTWAVENPRGVVLLAGDSQSWAVADGVIEAAGELGYDTTVATLNGCAFVYPVEDMELPGDWAGCREFRSAVTEFATSTRPSAVVISNWSLGYVGDEPESRRRWALGLVGMFDALNDIGVPVVLVSSYPIGDDESISRSMIIRPDADRSTDAVRSREERAWLIGLETELAAAYDDVYILDPYEVLCDRSVCWTAVGGTEYYTDTNHLSRAGSLLLAPALAEILGGEIP